MLNKKGPYNKAKFEEIEERNKTGEFIPELHKSLMSEFHKDVFDENSSTGLK